VKFFAALAVDIDYPIKDFAKEMAMPIL